MMKKIILSLLFLIVGLSLVGADNFDIQVVSVASVSGNPGETVDINVQIKNEGVETIDVVQVESSDLTFGSEIITKPTTASIIGLGLPSIWRRTSSFVIRSVLVDISLASS